MAPPPRTPLPHAERLLLALLIGTACVGGSSTTTPADGTSTNTTTSPAPTSVTSAPGSTTASTSGPAATSTGLSGTTDTGVPACGNGLCALDETASTCCEDCGVCDDRAVVRMETGVEGGAPGAGLTPGGIADTHAQFAGGSFTEVVFPFTIEQGPVEGSSWFWAQQFFFENTTQGGYLGLQSNGIIEGAAIGKMAIFSIWDATEATPGSRAGCEAFGGEGVGQSCRLPFEWRDDVTYTMTLQQAEPSWWRVTLHDPTTDDDLELGTIHAPDPWGLVRPPTAGFAEYYGTVDSCDTLPHAVALLHQPRADGMAPTFVDAGTYGRCMAQASSTCAGPLCR